VGEKERETRKNGLLKRGNSSRLGENRQKVSKFLKGKGRGCLNEPSQKETRGNVIKGIWKEEESEKILQ